ncbi:MAG: nicotinate-nicotinamide nucleotide adenylyltransferase [Massilia sp.]|nr:nicotinate-nicotinamide nucleotide adenylyltransferase [Massilia sp.]
MRCTALLGGSFDPVHAGHVALAALFDSLLHPDELRIIPAGNPYQKAPLQVSSEQRIAMLELAFGAAGLKITIDRQEIDRQGPSYTIDTLRKVRADVGPDVALVFLMGADQLMKLDTWRDWQRLFEYAHIGVAARPGYSLAAASLPPAVAAEITVRQGSLDQLRTTPSGRVYLAETLAVDISATQIRAALRGEGQPGIDACSLIPPVVLDYIQQHHLYKN